MGAPPIYLFPLGSLWGLFEEVCLTPNKPWLKQIYKLKVAHYMLWCHTCENMWTYFWLKYYDALIFLRKVCVSHIIFKYILNRKWGHLFLYNLLTYNILYNMNHHLWHNVTISNSMICILNAEISLWGMVLLYYFQTYPK